MRTFLVTGGAGFVGSHITEALLARGDRVRVFDDFSTGHRENIPRDDRVEVLEGNVTDLAAVERAVQGVDCIFHEAALASVPRSIESPLDTHAACVTGTVVLLAAAQKAGVRRVVYAGSSSAYGDKATSSKREGDLPGPLSPYAAAKLAGEFYCQAFAHSFGLETVVLRYFNVFGPRQDPNSPYSAVIPLFVTAMLAGRSPVIYGDGRQSRDFTFVGNVVHGNLLAADAKGVSGGVFNVANGRSTTLLKLIAVLNEYLGTHVQPVFKPPRTGDVRESLADISEARMRARLRATGGIRGRAAPHDRLLPRNGRKQVARLRHTTGAASRCLAGLAERDDVIHGPVEFAALPAFGNGFQPAAATHFGNAHESLRTYGGRSVRGHGCPGRSEQPRQRIGRACARDGPQEESPQSRPGYHLTVPAFARSVMLMAHR